MSAIFWASYVFLYFVVLTESLIIFGLLSREASRRSVGTRQEEAPAQVVTGAPLPELSGFLAGTKQPANWKSILRPGRSAVVFLTPHCTSCNKVGRLLEGWVLDREEHVAVIVEGRQQDVTSFIERTKLDPMRVVVDEFGLTGKAIGFEIRPGAVTVLDGRLALGAVTESLDALDELLKRTKQLNEQDNPAALAAGVVARVNDHR